MTNDNDPRFRPWDGKLHDVRACDICNDITERQAKWFFKSQILPTGFPVDFLFEMLEHPEWLLCPTCHELLLAKNITGLLDRNQHPVMKNPKSREKFKQLYMSLINNLPQN